MNFLYFQLMPLTTILDILGTFAFAVSGAFAAMQKRFDPFGILIIAFVTAIGGGTIRDVLIGDLPVAWLTNEIAAIVIVSGAAMSLFLAGTLHRLEKLLFLFDAAGLGLFTILGIEKGLKFGFTPGICIALGTITACFGGVLRDVLLGNVPLIFRKEIYASACIAGGILYWLLKQLEIIPSISNTVAIASIVIIRILAVKFNWSLPKWYKA